MADGDITVRRLALELEVPVADLCNLMVALLRYPEQDDPMVPAMAAGDGGPVVLHTGTVIMARAADMLRWLYAEQRALPGLVEEHLQQQAEEPGESSG